MSEAHAILTDYADELISVPRDHLRMELAQDETGLTLTHYGNTVVHCRLTREGRPTRNSLRLDSESDKQRHSSYESRR